MKLSDENILNYKELISPEKLKNTLPLTEKSKQTIIKSRKIIKNILEKKDPRKIIILGPCSIHNINEALIYAKKIKKLQEKIKDKFFLVMRTYFEKPRSTTGWKGLIYDPDLNNSNNVEKGLKKSRKLLLDITNLGVATATEFLGIITPQYIDDLISWAAIGARTTESQPHRELVSGLSMPVGFKNSTYGDIDIAINAMKASMNKHSFLGIDNKGKVSIVNTKGNKFIHIILRGGKTPNYKKKSVDKISLKLKKQNLPNNLIIDCSHGNSNKDYIKQPIVFENIISQLKNDENNISGIMLESNLNEGNQKISNNLKFGVSITDECINWDTTEEIILEGYNQL